MVAYPTFKIIRGNRSIIVKVRRYWSKHSMRYRVYYPKKWRGIEIGWAQNMGLFVREKLNWDDWDKCAYIGKWKADEKPGTNIDEKNDTT